MRTPGRVTDAQLAEEYTDPFGPASLSVLAAKYGLSRKNIRKQLVRAGVTMRPAGFLPTLRQYSGETGRRRLKDREEKG